MLLCIYRYTYIYIYIYSYIRINNIYAQESWHLLYLGSNQLLLHPLWNLQVPEIPQVSSGPKGARNGQVQRCFQRQWYKKKGNTFGDDLLNPAGNDVLLKGTRCKLQKLLLTERYIICCEKKWSFRWPNYRTWRSDSPPSYWGLVELWRFRSLRRIWANQRGGAGAIVPTLKCDLKNKNKKRLLGCLMVRYVTIGSFNGLIIVSL